MEWTTLEQLAPSARRGGTVALCASLSASAFAFLAIGGAPGLHLVWTPALIAGWALREGPLPSASLSRLWQACHLAAGFVSVACALALPGDPLAPVARWMAATVVVAGYAAGRRALGG